jgi:acetyl-CoA acyltransferase
LKQAGLSINDIGLIELNEALPHTAVIRELGLNPDIVNVNGVNRYGTPTGMYWS